MTSVIDICRIPETVPSNIIMSSQPRSWFKTPFAFHPAHQNTLTTARRRQFATPEISHHKEPRNIFSKICFQDISILQEYWTWDICHKMGNKVKLTNLLQSRLPRKFKVFPSEILSVFRRTINTLIEKSLKKLFFLCSIFDETNDMKRPINTEVHDH